MGWAVGHVRQKEPLMSQNSRVSPSATIPRFLFSHAQGRAQVVKTRSEYTQWFLFFEGWKGEDGTCCTKTFP